MQDIVTRGGKFVFMYKRQGKRVIVNAKGHMMVSPSLIETWIQQHTVGMVQPSHHLFSMLAYASSCKAFHANVMGRSSCYIPKPHLLAVKPSVKAG